MLRVESGLATDPGPVLNTDLHEPRYAHGPGNARGIGGAVTRIGTPGVLDRIVERLPRKTVYHPPRTRPGSAGDVLGSHT